jgi:hypothetical protein
MKANKEMIDKRNECGILNMSSSEMIPMLTLLSYSGNTIDKSLLTK